MTEGALFEVARCKGWNEDFALLAALSWPFFLKVALGCPPVFQKRAGEDLRCDDGFEEKAAVGLVAGFLTPKLRRRKNVAARPRITRGCICDSRNFSAPNAACGPLLPHARGQETRVFPAWSGKRVLNSAREFARAGGGGSANRLAAHAFRRGAARAITQPVRFFAQPLKAGPWHFSAFRVYPNLC